MPDYRLEKLPALYAGFVKQRDLLASEGLSESEIDKLEKYKFLPGSNKFVLALNDLFKK